MNGVSSSAGLPEHATQFTMTQPVADLLGKPSESCETGRDPLESVSVWAMLTSWCTPPQMERCSRNPIPRPAACPPRPGGGYEQPATALARSLGRAPLAQYYDGNHRDYTPVAKAKKDHSIKVLLIQVR